MRRGWGEATMSNGVRTTRRLRSAVDPIGNLLAEGFHLVVLFGIGAATVWAAVRAFSTMLARGDPKLEDLLLLFIYLEIGSMVGIYFRTNHMPVRFLVYVAITALTRHMIVVVQNESAPDLGVLILAAGTLVLALAVLVIRYASFHYPSERGEELDRGPVGDARSAPVSARAYSSIRGSDPSLARSRENAILQKGKPRAALSARDDASLARKPGRNAVSATIISNQQAALRVARVGAVVDAFLVGGAVASGVGAGAWQAFAADEFDKSTMTYGLLGLAILLAVTAYIVHVRRAAWPAKLTARSIGLPPAGSDVSADDAGLTIATRTWLWSELQIDEVHIVSRSAGDGSTSHQIERLVLTAAGGPLALDTFLMRGGQPVVDAAFRRAVREG